MWLVEFVAKCGRDQKRFVLSQLLRLNPFFLVGVDMCAPKIGEFQMRPLIFRETRRRGKSGRPASDNYLHRFCVRIQALRCLTDFLYDTSPRLDVGDFIESVKNNDGMRVAKEFEELAWGNLHPARMPVYLHCQESL